MEVTKDQKESTFGNGECFVHKIPLRLTDIGYECEQCQAERVERTRRDLEKMSEFLSRIESATVNPPPVISGAVKFTMEAKIGELVENVHGLKSDALVIRQENIPEIVVACILAYGVPRLEATCLCMNCGTTIRVSQQHEHLSTCPKRAYDTTGHTHHTQGVTL